MTTHPLSDGPALPESAAPARVDVVIVGGGIGGLASAVALTRAGLTCRVLEQAPAFGEVGAGLQIAPNCTRILREWDLFDEIAELGVLPRSIVMRDAVDGEELTRLDLVDAEKRYGAPYVVIHRSDLHGTLLRAAQRLGVDLVTDCTVTAVEQDDTGARAISAGRVDTADLLLGADGLHSLVRPLFSDDQPVSSAYVAYRGAVPIDTVRDNDVSLDDVVCYVGPGCHFVQYPLRGGEMFNQVAVFESPKALAGYEDWGTPDELDAAFAGTCEQVRIGLPHMWRDRWWRMFDRDPIDTWVSGRIALTGDAAHPPLQYLAQGAVMAIEDAYILTHHVTAHRDAAGRVDWTAALAAYEAVRPAHCRRVLSTARKWGELWHVAGDRRRWRNEVLRARDVLDYSFVDWLYGPTATRPAELAPMFEPIPYSPLTAPTVS